MRKNLKKFRKKLYEKNKIDYKMLGGRYNGPSRRKFRIGTRSEYVVADIKKE